MLFNIDKMNRLAKLAKTYGCQVAGTMLFTLSPVHDDAYYADKADKLSALPEVDSLLLYDTGGVLDRERISKLVPAIVASLARQAGRDALEQHAGPVGEGLHGRDRIRRVRCCTPPCGRWPTVRRSRPSRS